MGSLRARLSKSDIDRDVQHEVDQAKRAIDRAIQLCRRVKKGGGIEAKRSWRIARDLARVKSTLGTVGRLTPLYDLDDPDLMSEDERSRRMWEAREAERAARGAVPEVVEEAPEPEVSDA